MSGSYFYEWLFGAQNFSGLSRNASLGRETQCGVKFFAQGNNTMAGVNPQTTESRNENSMTTTT